MLRKISIDKHYIDIFEDSRQNIWLASKWKIAMIGVNGEVKNHDEFELLSDERVGGFIEEAGEVWGLSAKYGNKYHLSHVLNADAPRLANISETDPKKIIPTKAVFLSASNSYSIHDYINTYLDRASVEESYVSKTHDYEDGNLWACTFDGAFRINKKEGTFKQFFQDKQIAHVLKDLENGYWFTTLGSGVFFVPHLENQSISVIDNIDLGNTIVVFSENDKFWFGANKAKFGYIDNNVQKVSSFYMSKGRSRVKRIIKGKAPGDLFVVLEEALLLRKGDGTIGRIDGSIKNIQKWTDQVYVIGTTYGLTFVDVDKLYDNLHYEPGTRSPEGSWGFSNQPFSIKHLTTSSVIDIEPYGKGLLVATSRGLYYVNGQMQEKRMVDHWVMNSVINDISVLNDSTYILASSAYGSFMFNGEKVIQFSTENGLSSNIHRKVYPQNDSIFWLATNAGINQVMLDQGKVLVRSVGFADGLMSEDVNDVTIWKSNLVAATSKGISKIEISSLEKDWQHLLRISMLIRMCRFSMPLLIK
jgi:ligand-binding sensor domain-containing protein